MLQIEFSKTPQSNTRLDVPPPMFSRLVVLFYMFLNHKQKIQYKIKYNKVHNFVPTENYTFICKVNFFLYTIIF